MSRITEARTLEQLAICREGERYLRAGEIRRAAALLKDITPARATPEARLGLAKLARRTGQASLGLRLLHGHLRPEERSREQAAQVAEYAILLLENGALREAEQILRRSDSRLHPDQLLAQTWCFFEAWHFEPTLPLLRDYIDRQKDPYLRLAGVVNLGEATMATHRKSAAVPLLGAAIREAEGQGFSRLLANALHLRARAYFFLGQLGPSDEDLRRALKLFGGSRVSDAILVHRQWAINRATESKSVAPLDLFRKEAVAAKAWESVRECDFVRLQLRFSQPLYDRLYYGTPHERYRQRLAAAAGARTPSASFRWGERMAKPLDLAEEEFPWRGLTLRPTPQTRRLLFAVLGDFYRPVRVGSLFSQLFPGELFDPVHSPARVHQALRRLRRWFVKEQIPLELICQERAYSFRTLGAFAFRVPLELRLSNGPLDSIHELVAQFGGQPNFSAKAAREALGVPKATMTRTLQAALAAGALESFGQGKNTRYRLMRK